MGWHASPSMARAAPARAHVQGPRGFTLSQGAMMVVTHECLLLVQPWFAPPVLPWLWPLRGFCHMQTLTASLCSTAEGFPAALLLLCWL